MKASEVISGVWKIVERQIDIMTDDISDEAIKETVRDKMIFLLEPHINNSEMMLRRWDTVRKGCDNPFDYLAGMFVAHVAQRMCEWDGEDESSDGDMVITHRFSAN